MRAVHEVLAPGLMVAFISSAFGAPDSLCGVLFLFGTVWFGGLGRHV